MLVSVISNIACSLHIVWGRAVTNVVRACGPAHLLVFDFMSNKICLNQTVEFVADGAMTEI